MGCCPTTYYCTPGGIVAVEADEDGVYTPPDDATGGPYATREGGGAECPYVICDPPFEVSAGGFVVSIVDRAYTGEADPPPADPWAENSYSLDDYSVGDDGIAIHSGRVRFNGFDDAVDVVVGFSCTDEDACGGVLVTIAFSGWSGAAGGNPVAGGIVNSSNGWVIRDGGVYGVSWYKCFTDPADIVFPLDVGTITYSIYVGSVPPAVIGPFTARVIIDVA